MIAKDADLPPVDLCVERRSDGTMVISNAVALPDGGWTIPSRLSHWATCTPNRIFLSEPTASGRRYLTYADALATAGDWAGRLLSLDLGPARPAMIIAGNSINHALAMLAATSVAIPAAIVSPTYVAAQAAPYGKLDRLVRQIAPGLILAERPDLVGVALSAIGRDDITVHPLSDTAWISDVPPADRIRAEAARASVTPDSVAKLLFTSGSTGTPKAVVNTQRMMTSNMQAVGAVLPWLEARPPILVDWLPWNHTFGGNCCFNIALFFGGTLHIDGGKPLPDQVGLTVQALREHSPSIYFNVPAGFDALLPYLEQDLDLARRFLSGLDFLFNGGAAMPHSIRRRIEELASRTIGRVPRIIVGWGSTETAPFSTVTYFETDHAANLGVPIPGTEIKLVPSGGRTEMRVRGPNVMPGYWRDPDATAAAFDEEGFYRIGDAGRFADPEKPERGLLFDGRTAENFKLSSGTWVNVGALRLAIIAATRPFVSDAVVTGEGRDQIGLLLFLSPARSAALSDHEREARISELLADYNSTQSGSSLRISRFLILSEPPRADQDEITEKGYLNQRALLANRAASVEALYACGHIVGQRTAPLSQSAPA